ncbi:hypothetical protein FBZ93_111163 [Bradyrhizobium macuxiense]|uniref:Uncharacterized protein n=1 Tax=Bradyrhizobium macuxiense TaxID=1755647 RepID=A0A560LFD7_9BRAD|nr:hypothetical protein FBZ93_111163 [Bradyrhizobium macuxiense]
MATNDVALTRNKLDLRLMRSSPASRMVDRADRAAVRVGTPTTPLIVLPSPLLASFSHFVAPSRPTVSPAEVEAAQDGADALLTDYAKARKSLATLLPVETMQRASRGALACSLVSFVQRGPSVSGTARMGQARSGPAYLLIRTAAIQAEMQDDTMVRCAATIRVRPRIASPIDTPECDRLPHLFCSRLGLRRRPGAEMAGVSERPASSAGTWHIMGLL